MQTTEICTDIEDTVPQNWSYSLAFSRNKGLIGEQDQQRLRNCTVAIPGMGGVGGLHLIALTRLGIGNFTIADPDVFEQVNFNRQYGASVDTIGQSKVEVMAEAARAINPSINIRCIDDYIDHRNVDEFLEGADVLVDGIDLYQIDARRQIFAAAAKKGIPAITAGPMGFSTCWLTFGAKGMSFDKYFDISSKSSRLEKMVAFLMGLCPRMLPLQYMDRNAANPVTGCAPSVSAGCQLAAGVMAAEVTKVLLNRGPVKYAPHYRIFDAYLNSFKSGYLLLGNRHPWQLAKRLWLLRDWKKRFPEYV